VWVFLSGSRGSLLIAVVCLGFLLVAMRLRHTLFVGIVATLVSMLVISQFTTFQQRAIERLRLLADPSQSATERTSGRFDLVVGAWHMFRDHPLGVGTGGFTTTWTELQSREGMTQWHRSRPTPAHSGWMKVLAENGFPGIVLLAGYVVSFAVRGWRARAPHLQRLGLMVTAVLAVAWISSEFQNKAVWFIAAGATVLLDYGSKRGAARSAVNGV